MIHEDMIEAIKKNLSAEVGSALKTELEELGKLRTKVKDQANTIVCNDDDLVELRRRAKAWDIIREREQKVIKRELKIKLVEQRAELAEFHRKSIFDLVEIVFRNKKLVHNETSTVQKVTECGNDYSTVNPYPESKTVIVTEE